jgi:GWxTD domain-containing protein
VVRVYLEGYGFAEPPRVALAALGEGTTAPVWSDTVTLGRIAGVHSTVAEIPVAQLGVGRLALTAAAVGAPADSVRTPLFVTFGDEWAIASFEEMLQYLRYFTNLQRLDALRTTPPSARAAAWAAFYRETDPDPSSPEHEGLRDYFNRLQLASERFREEGQPGWLTDRGRVYITLGDPDQVLEQGDNTMAQRGRAQVWLYGQYRLQLVFVDQSGFGRWRLTAASESDFNMVAARERK